MNPSDLRFVMREWEKAESPMVYWYKKLKEHDRKGSLDQIDLDNFVLSNFIPLVRGLPQKEALAMCKNIYTNSIAKVTIQIAEDSVLMTKRDFTVTFAEQLSIISMCQIVIKTALQIMLTYFQVAQLDYSQE